VWFPAPARRSVAPEAPAPVLVALLLLTVAMVAAGLANAPIVTRILAPAAAR
jgi:hypothetical protein